jgi:glycosyltransferase involved in cell wall biosynthesis
MLKGRISVVVPALNSAATLSWTLCSLRSQKDIAVEIVVADSGSKDGTLEICEKWGVKTIYVPPGNMYRAINTGLREMDSDWVTYLNSDDVVFPDAYARLVALGESQSASLAYGDCDFMDYEGRYLFTQRSVAARGLAGVIRVSPSFGGRTGFTQPGAVYRRSAFEELKGFDERYRLIADYDFFFRLVMAKYRVARLDRPAVAAFRLHRSQLSTRERTNLENEMALFRKSVSVNSSPGDWADVLFWRLKNSSTFLSRIMRLRP